MRFSKFILENLEPIIEEWVVYARLLSPAGTKMSRPALADHSKEILVAIAEDMEVGQDEATRQSKAEGGAAPPLESQGRTAATAHGAVRQLNGFDLDQMVSEYRALRACVLRLWRNAAETGGDRGQAVEEIARFNEGIDQALAESVKQYTRDVAISRDLFLGVLAHDLRGPLSIIDNSISLIAMPNAPAGTMPQAIERIRRSSKGMRSLINDLLDYTQTRSGHGLTVTPATCDLRETCEKALDAMQAKYPQQQFAVDLVGDLALQADERRLEQVLANLLNNAVRHGDQHAPISLTAHGDADTVLFSVTNQGRPIHPDLLPTIFEPLVQSVEADRSQSSIGLGLFIVREIVRGHQGAIDVESSEARGTVFTVKLPRRLR
jgi:signal transduction histidine kinase